jgi:hypothetical protein
LTRRQHHSSIRFGSRTHVHLHLLLDATSNVTLGDVVPAVTTIVAEFERLTNNEPCGPTMNVVATPGSSA